MTDAKYFRMKNQRDDLRNALAELLASAAELGTLPSDEAIKRASTAIKETTRILSATGPMTDQDSS